MGNSELRRLEREIEKTSKKLEAVQRGEWWPLNSRERRAIAGALVGGSYQVARGRSTGRADQRLETAGTAAQMRLTAELTALHGERQRLITEAARAKAAKKKSGWF
ncbi:hypothetical protein ACFU9Y_39350 [Streptomyces sp. NPDC057621]|uniref:hypothetical protein n=1 Tax=Streptomyces sp. NPDC057621 TaxID=3346186 RepID=UPI00368126F1